eukprot:TRINITY_DN24789_c0_g1_i1.p1 TRINITY_DN24789_c0_g1~~TRINITY_DN24789_c0_g1_i1.p1  ORF type:complete len:262 (+),score=45.33 TRINITY_DN24789_c0_g1_i1:78-788(+)
MAGAGVTGLTSVTELNITFVEFGIGGDYTRPLNLKKNGFQILSNIFPSLRKLSLQQLRYDLTELNELGAKLEIFQQDEPSYGFCGHKVSRVEEFMKATSDSIKNLQLVVEQYESEEDFAEEETVTLTIQSNALRHVRLFILGDINVHFKDCPSLVDAIVCKLNGDDDDDDQIAITSSGCPWIPSKLVPVMVETERSIEIEEPDFELQRDNDYGQEDESGREDEGEEDSEDEDSESD